MSEQRNPWPHIGQLFVEQGRLTTEQVEDALVEQQSTGNPLGEILVARGHISRIDLAAALSTQWTWQKAGRPLDEPAAELATSDVPVAVETTEPEPSPTYEPEPSPTYEAVTEPPTAPVPALPPVAMTVEPEPFRTVEPEPFVTAQPEPFSIAPAPPPPPQPPVDPTGGLERRVTVLEDSARLVADLQARLRSAYEQLAAAEARLGALEPSVAALAQAYNALVAQLQAQRHELEALRAASVKHEAQIATAARALLA